MSYSSNIINTTHFEIVTNDLIYIFIWIYMNEIKSAKYIEYLITLKYNLNNSNILFGKYSLIVIKGY